MRTVLESLQHGESFLFRLQRLEMIMCQAREAFVEFFTCREKVIFWLFGSFLPRKSFRSDVLHFSVITKVHSSSVESGVRKTGGVWDLSRIKVKIVTFSLKSIHKKKCQYQTILSVSREPGPKISQVCNKWASEIDLRKSFSIKEESHKYFFPVLWPNLVPLDSLIIFGKNTWGRIDRFAIDMIDQSSDPL